MESDSGTEETAAALYDLPSGWSFSIPGPKDSVCQPPASCTSVFLKQLEFGLRFPLHPFISLLLRRANVAIIQLHPLAIRTMVAWTWVCLFKGWELLVDIFHSLHYLKMGTGPSERYWSLYTDSGYCTSYPKLTSVKGWRERWLLIRSSAPFVHSRQFRNNVYARFEAVEEWCPGKVRLVTDIYPTPDQTEVWEFFWACHNKKSEVLSSIWLPPVDVITEDLYLSRVGLLPARPLDTYSGGRSKEELARIGLNADSTPVTNAPDVPSPLGKISLRTKIMELKKLRPGEAKVRMPLHRSEELARLSHTRVAPTADSAAGLPEAPMSGPKSKSRSDHEPARSDLGPGNGMEAPEVVEEISLRSKKGLRTGPSGSRSTKRLKIILSNKVTVASSCPLSQGAEEDPPEVVTTRASGAVSTASSGAVAARSPSVALIISTEAVVVGAPSVTFISSTGAAAVRAPGVVHIPSTGAAAMGTPSVVLIPSTGAAAVRASGVWRRSYPFDWGGGHEGAWRCSRYSDWGVVQGGRGEFSAELAEVKGELVDVLSKFDTQKDELRAANDKCELVGAERDKLREELGLLSGELEASRASEAAVRAELESARVSEAAAKTAYASLKGTLDQVNALRVEAYNKGYVQGDLDTKEVVAELYPNFDFEALLLLEEKRDKRRATGSLK
ncbi:hypothetical protein RND81_09G025000 [Saponaria officinalis]|uniref:Uncharacterized protein n=1 Tax=Saponaria officinalis TaxID=3572 RepID=A0AAW1IHV0_SAPOF